MVEHSIHCPKLPWMIDFHSSAEGTIPNSQLKAAYADNWLQHLSFLNYESQTPRKRLTGILCTIGPSCYTTEILESMMEAGMTAIRIKMAYFSQEECMATIKLIREATNNYSKKIGRVYPLAIALDIKGPEIRMGSLKDFEAKSISLIEGNTIFLTTDPAYEEHVTEDMIFVDYQKINEVVEPGDDIYFPDGKAYLSALEIVGSIIKCVINRAGQIASGDRVSLPGILTDLPSLSEKDEKDIRFGVEQEVDFILASCVKDAETVNLVKEVLGEKGENIMVISKIQSIRGLENFDEILKASDGIMLARNVLTVEITPEKIFLIQKSVMSKCNKAGKPVLLGSLMLESMVKNPLPNRAEICDVANAILDGADCLVLSKETAEGDNVVDSINTISSICKEAEAAIYQRQIFNCLSEKVLSPIEPIYAIAISSVMTALKCNAAAIILCTTTGRSAKILSQYRPRCPIIAITRYGHVARQLHLFRSVDPIHYIHPLKMCWQRDVDVRIQFGISYGKLSGFIRTGDALVVVTGARQGSGFTNALKVVYASACDALPPEEQTLKNNKRSSADKNGKKKTSIKTS